MSTHLTRLTTVLVVAISTALVVAGCAAQKPARDVDLGGAEETGFLDDYTILKKRTGGDDLQGALYGYFDEGADFAAYDKMLLDPVEVWRSAGGAPLADVQRLSNDFYALLYKELSKDYTMVQYPGPNTLRFNVLLMNLQKGTATMDKVTSAVPIGLALSTTKDFVTGKPAFVGEASVQGKLTDAETGKLIAAAVDRRVGGKNLMKEYDSWADVQTILELWSRAVRFRLCIERIGKPGDCPRPASA